MNNQNIRTLLKKYNLHPNFTYGQNFLTDESVIEDIISSAALTSKDVVLEIGPGIGNLTEKLCQRAGFVLSVEKDPKFLPILKKIKKDYSKNFYFEIKDVLEFNFQNFFLPLHSKFSNLNPGYKVVANIPYYITGKILQMFFTTKIKPVSITILTQKEVAKNIVAKKGDLSVLSISVQVYGEPKIIKIVPANVFYPTPKVDSAILQIDLFAKNKFKVDNEKKFFKLLKACFSGKRKQIHNTLKNNLGLKEEQVAYVLGKLKIDPTLRPQELSIEEWLTLEQEIKLLA